MIEYKIAAVLWLIACTAWFCVGYTLGKKNSCKKGVKEETGLSKRIGEIDNSCDCEHCCYKASPLCKDCILVHSPSGIQKTLFVRKSPEFKYFRRGKRKLPDVTIQEALMNENTIPLEVLLDYNFQCGKIDN